MHNLRSVQRLNNTLPRLNPRQSSRESTDTDTEFFPGNFEPANVAQVNRFVELSGTSLRKAKKWLHQQRDNVTGRILFNQALVYFFQKHDHEDDEEYVYGSDGCNCLEQAAERVLGEIVREVREELEREQADEEYVWDKVQGKLAQGYECFREPHIIVDAVREKFRVLQPPRPTENPSLHEAFFMRSCRINDRGRTRPIVGEGYGGNNFGE